MASNFVSIFFILSFIPSSLSLSFDLSTIGNQDVNLSGDAAISNQVIQVTPADAFKVGRAVYKEHLHLWDNSTGNLADFTTHFTFLIFTNSTTNFGHGLTFFLAPSNSTIPPNSCGCGLALSGDPPTQSYSRPFVAVEFDTYPDRQWDPSYPHVGIDINSVDSIATTRWNHNFNSGKDTEAWITYTASNKNLTVNFTYYSSYIDGYKQKSLSSVVDLRDYLPEYVVFGFSASTRASFETNNVKSWKFKSTLLQVEPEAPNSSTKKGLIIGLSVGGSILILLLPFVGYYILKRYGKESRERDFMDKKFLYKGPREFPYEQLCDATNKFLDDNKLGEGGFGPVYKGFLTEIKSWVAVKRVAQGSVQGVKEYQSEVTVISQLKHKNLVQLVGWCHNKTDELLLVYEFMEKGSLDYHLFRREAGLTWSLRYGIAKGLASALLYMHEEVNGYVLHRDIKSSNILLDSKFNAKLGDFGLARLVDPEKSAQVTFMAGTRGYIAPECAVSGQATKESDVYSFGVVLLEIACGRRVITNGAQGKPVVLVEVVWGLYGEGNVLEAADPNLKKDFNDEQMKRLIMVGLCCVHPDASHRPSISEAWRYLNFEAQLPDLPRKMPPVFSYATQSDQRHSSNKTSSSSGGLDTALSAV